MHFSQQGCSPFAPWCAESCSAIRLVVLMPWRNSGTRLLAPLHPTQLVHAAMIGLASRSRPLQYLGLTSVTPFDVAARTISKSQHLEVNYVRSAKIVYLVATKSDLQVLERRHNGPLNRSKLFAIPNDNTYDLLSGTLILVGGESGCGKTMHMITGHCNEVDAVVYARCSPEALRCDHRELVNSICTNDAIYAVSCGDSAADARGARNRDFLALVVKIVNAAVDQTSHMLHEALRAYKSASRNAPFRVRVCLDDIGVEPAFLRACCELGTCSLSYELGWSDSVALRVVAGGSGVYSVKSPGGSECSFLKAVILPSRYAYPLLYLKMRRPFGAMNSVDATLGSATGAFVNLHAPWNDAAANRDAALRVALRSRSEQRPLADRHSAPGTPMDDKLILMQEAVFAAVESDSSCVAALDNPRLAELMVARCLAVARDTEWSEIYSPFRNNIRQLVLQPAVEAFKQLNGLEAGDSLRILIESLRHAVFDGYDCADLSKSHRTHDLIARCGVLVASVAEDVTWRRVPKNVHRYDISPAMFVVLDSLVAGACDDSFRKMGINFESAMAKFLFYAAQVFEGRPVTELVDFIIGPSAIVGEEVMRSLTTRDGAPRLVAFERIQLRVCCDNEWKTLWAATHESHAWVEISPPGLPSADVVLHIPGVITLAVQCYDKAATMSANDIRERLNSMTVPCERRTPEVNSSTTSKEVKDGAALAQRLVDLGAPVVAVLHTSRLLLFKDLQSSSSATFDAVGRFCVLTQGIAEATSTLIASLASTPGDARTDNWENDVRLNNIRKCMIQFDVSRVPLDTATTTTDIASAASSAPIADGLASYCPGSSARFTANKKALVTKNDQTGLGEPASGTAN
jgi:hypothetical protein